MPACHIVNHGMHVTHFTSEFSHPPPRTFFLSRSSTPSTTTTTSTPSPNRKNGRRKASPHRPRRRSQQRTRMFMKTSQTNLPVSPLGGSSLSQSCEK
ncbi:hypothetical protein EYC84_007269 [Monilinia fructicola]|uniref:Uncharacterized protein n=1 Tax=Monilinia fructicola TaxID=38448 RepID=A0A5M9K8T9_MONFR|nr:hypothetical protein EYC84_007269 [Monilinia fructicola]